MNLEINDLLFLYTDGVTEAENITQELYSEKQLMKCLSAARIYEPKNLVELAAEDVARHVEGNDQSDDITILSVIYYGK